MPKHCRIGDKFTLTDDALENYGERWRGVVFTVTHVATSRAGHPGYDAGMKGAALYDADADNGASWNNSVYDYEIERR